MKYLLEEKKIPKKWGGKNEKNLVPIFKIHLFVIFLRFETTLNCLKMIYKPQIRGQNNVKSDLLR